MVVVVVELLKVFPALQNQDIWSQIFLVSIDETTIGDGALNSGEKETKMVP